MPRFRRASEPVEASPPGMPADLAAFDPDDWPLPELVEAETADDDFLLAKRRRAWRIARAAWLTGADYPDLATAEGRTRSHEYATALRRAQIWRNDR